MQFAAKEISRLTSQPVEQDWKSAQRRARYWKDNKRKAIEYNSQRLPENVVAWSDADCRAQANKNVNVRRRGDVREPLRQDRQPDAGDDRFVVWRVGVLRDREGAAMGPGVKGLMEDFGVGVEVQVSIDSSAAKITNNVEGRRRTSKTR